VSNDLHSPAFTGVSRAVLIGGLPTARSPAMGCRVDVAAGLNTQRTLCTAERDTGRLSAAQVGRHAAVVWWPRVELVVAQDMLGRI